MSDELQRPPDEEEKDMETVLEKESPVERVDKEDTGEDDENESISAEQLRAELGEIGSRVKTAGLKPARQMLRSYVDNMLDAVDGLLSALEGNKRKKGD
jgi:hypothetical protein